MTTESEPEDVGPREPMVYDPALIDALHDLEARYGLGGIRSAIANIWPDAPPERTLRRARGWGRVTPLAELQIPPPGEALPGRIEALELAFNVLRRIHGERLERIEAWHDEAASTRTAGGLVSYRLPSRVITEPQTITRSSGICEPSDA